MPYRTARPAAAHPLPARPLPVRPLPVRPLPVRSASVRPVLAALIGWLAIVSSSLAADLALRPTRHDPVGSDVVRTVPRGGDGFRAGVAVGGAVGVGGALTIGNTTIGAGVGAAAAVGVGVEFERTGGGGRAVAPVRRDAALPVRRKRGDPPIAIVPPGDLPPVTVPAVRPVIEDVELEEDLPPPLPRSTLRLPDATPDSSFVRIGRPASETRVADGRIDRPAPRPGSAGELPGGGDTEGGLVVVRQELDDLVTQIARFYGFDAVLTRQVRGTVENERLPSDLNAFIARLTAERDLVFYFRNRDLNVSARSENVSRVIGLGPSDPRELRAAIEAAGVDADRFPLRFIEASNSVLVDGPPSFVALVEVIAESLVRTTRNAPAVTVIRGNQIDRQSPDANPAPAATVPPVPPAQPAAQ